MRDIVRDQNQGGFARHVTSIVNGLRTCLDELFASDKVVVSAQATREARELRDALQSLQRQDVERSVLKLSFLWHRELAGIFSAVVDEGLSHAGVYVPSLVADIGRRAEAMAAAIGAEFVSVDLLCSRFAPGMAPIHVDYAEFLKNDRCELNINHRRALSFVMPYVGQGTEYLVHSRQLIEGPLRDEIVKNSNSILGLSATLDACPEAARLPWISTGSDSFTVHRNGLSIHRSPSSLEFRLLLAVDSAIPDEKMQRPLDAVRERIIRNSRLIRGLRSEVR